MSMSMAMTRKWAVWIPVLMAASLLYWAVALGLGELSLKMVGSLDTDVDGRLEIGASLGQSMDAQELRGADLKDSYEPIPVNLVESSDTRDVGESPVDSSASAPAQPPSDQGPGQTAF